MRRLFAFALLFLAVLVAGCGSEESAPAPSTTPTSAGQLHQPAPPVHRPAVAAVPVPSKADTESKGDGLVAAAGARCGRERWAVKTATDPAASNIRLAPQETTVETLDALPTTNPGNPDQPRDSGAESTVYKITAVLEAAKREADSDFHLALSDGKGLTMIAEIPDAPACTEPPVTERVSVLEQQIEQARTAFVQAFGEPPEQGWMQIGKTVTLTGVGFFDVPHGQKNVAPNAVELHPVLSIEPAG